MSDTTLTIIVAAVSSTLTTLAVHAVQAWRYRPRPIDPELWQRNAETLLRALKGK